MTDKTIELIADTDEELQEKLAAAVADTIDEVLNEMLLRVFERSQQNLIDPMPWEGRAGKSVIFDTGNLMRSGELDVKDRFVKRITYKAFYADMVEFGCFTEETEILAATGWKSLRDVSRSDVVMTLNPKNMQAEWQQVDRKFEYDYKGQLCHFKNNAIPMLLTPNHRIYLFNREMKNFGWFRADSIPSKGIVPRIGGWVGKDDDFVTVPVYEENHYIGKHKKYIKIIHPKKKIPIKTWLKFFGLFISEGNVSDYRVTITQSIKSRYFKCMEAAIEEMPFKISKFRRNNKYPRSPTCDFRINSKQLADFLHKYGKAKDKFIPLEIKNLGKENLEILLRYMLMGDGCNFSNGRKFYWRYYTTSKRLAGDVQEIALKIGKVGQLEMKRHRNTKWSDCYSILLRDNVCSWLDVRDRILEEYEGKVYCVSVRNGIVFVRHGGRPYFSGNSPPHMPPEAPIRAWCRRKLGLKGKELEAAVEGIKWKIYHEGVEPHPFLRPSIKEILG